MRRVLINKEKQQQLDDDFPDLGNNRLAYADRIEYLPTRWFGYQAVDVMFLTTGNDVFIKSLLEEQSNCKEALLEWVQRGGKLVISVGHNDQWVDKLLEKTPLIDCKIKGKVYRRHLALQPWISGFERSKDFPGSGMEVARLEPGKGVQVLIREKDQGRDTTDAEDRPLIVQAPCGMGRVILCAFDLDLAPFTQWDHQSQLYKKVRDEI